MKLKASRYHNEDPVYYKYREFVVGLFVLIPFLLIPAILAVILIRSDWARQRFELNFSHTLNAQINEGNEVYILSKRVGLVKKVALNSSGHIDVTLRVDEQYRQLIRSDSKIRLRQKNMFMGDWQVELGIGGESSPMVEDGDTLELVPPLDLEKLTDELVAITGTVNEILDTAVHGGGIVSHLLNRDTTVNRRIFETSEQIRTALNSMNSVLSSSSHLLNSTSVIVDSVVAKRTPAVFDGVDTLIRRTDSAMAELNKLIAAGDSIPLEVSKSLELVNRDLEEADVLLKSIQKMRILKRRVEEVKTEKSSK